MREECLKNGGNLFLDMGYFHIKGIKSAMYEPYKFSAWLFEHRVVAESKYDYELLEVSKVKEGSNQTCKYQPTTKEMEY